MQRRVLIQQVRVGLSFCTSYQLLGRVPLWDRAVVATRPTGVRPEGRRRMVVVGGPEMDWLSERSSGIRMLAAPPF